MRRYGYRKNYTWNPSISYLCGIMASDGCLSNDGRHLNVTSKDLEMLKNVIDILELKVKVSTKRNGFGGFGHFVQFGNVALYDFLFQAGITPAKSKTIQKVSVPDKYYGDFLRGLFDGDGSIWGFWDLRWRSSLMYYVNIFSASRPFLEWVSIMNVKMAKTSPGKIVTGKRAYVLRYAKADSQKLYTLMYSEAGALCLTRKKKKFVDFLEADPYSDKAIVGRVLE